MIPRIRSTVFVYLVAVTLTILSITAPSSLAQVAGGTLTGTITDRTGSEIPNAQIVIKDLVSTSPRIFCPLNIRSLFRRPDSTQK